MDLDVGLHVTKGLQRHDKIRLHRAAYGVTEKYQCRRQLRKNKNKKKAEKSYIPGAFSKYSVPDCDFHIDEVVPITFISDSDVQLIKLA